jgi:DNA-binding CsgD family transcriptional regulator
VDGEIRYATTPGGARIAWAAYGQGPTVIACPSSAAVAQLARARGSAQPPFTELAIADSARLVVYDCAGTGHSGREVYDYTLDGLVAELQAVADASTPDGTFALLASWATGPAAIKYAVEHPERVGRLLLYQTWAAGHDWHALPGFADYRRSIEGATHEVVASFWARVGGDQRGREAHKRAAAFVDTVEPAVYLAFLDAQCDHDVADLLDEVRVPVWVASGTGSNMLSPDAITRRLAAAIPGAVFAGEVSYWDAEGFASLMRRALLEAPAELAASAAPARPPLHERRRSPALANLSDREREVLCLVAAGHRNAAIAGRLVLAPSTVARHVHNLLMKTGCANRVELAAYAHQAGLTADGAG